MKSSRTFSNSFSDGLNRFIKTSGISRDNACVIYGGDSDFIFKEFRILSWRSSDKIWSP
jgi:hypothetical protein